MENSIGWWLAKWAFLTPAREAYVGDDGERLTFAELNARCNRVANAFAAAGVGERVGLLLMNSTEFLKFEMAGGEGCLFCWERGWSHRDSDIRLSLPPAGFAAAVAGVAVRSSGVEARLLDVRLLDGRDAPAGHGAGRCRPVGRRHGVPVRRDAAGVGRDGGEAKTREAKTMVFHTAEGRDAKTGLPQSDADSARCSAAIDSAESKDTDSEPSAFARRTWLAAVLFGFALAKRKVVAADGAKWIWNVVAELFPGAVEIVDVWHAKERLWEVARAVCGSGTDLCRRWAEQVCEALWEGRIDGRAGGTAPPRDDDHFWRHRKKQAA